jgi:hypothetical protein
VSVFEQLIALQLSVRDDHAVVFTVTIKIGCRGSRCRSFRSLMCVGTAAFYRTISDGTVLCLLKT